jgi:hypothetical protein
LPQEAHRGRSTARLTSWRSCAHAAVSGRRGTQPQRATNSWPRLIPEPPRSSPRAWPHSTSSAQAARLRERPPRAKPIAVATPSLATPGLASPLCVAPEFRAADPTSPPCASAPVSVAPPNPTPNPTSNPPELHPKRCCSASRERQSQSIPHPVGTWRRNLCTGLGINVRCRPARDLSFCLTLARVRLTGDYSRQSLPPQKNPEPGRQPRTANRPVL